MGTLIISFYIFLKCNNVKVFRNRNLDNWGAFYKPIVFHVEIFTKEIFKWFFGVLFEFFVDIRNLIFFCLKEDISDFMRFFLHWIIVFTIQIVYKISKDLKPRGIIKCFKTKKRSCLSRFWFERQLKRIWQQNNILMKIELTGTVSNSFLFVS